MIKILSSKKEGNLWACDIQFSNGNTMKAYYSEPRYKLESLRNELLTGDPINEKDLEEFEQLVLEVKNYDDQMSD